MLGYRTLFSFFLVLLVSVLTAAPVFSVDIPGVRTPIPIIRNMLSNGDFESGVEGWQFGNINRVLIQGGAANGNYWLNTTNCNNCPTDFGNEKTIAYDINGAIPVGQKYSASVYFRSPQSGTAEFVVWALGGTTELFSTFNKTGTGNWQKLEINNFQIQNSGHTTLRVQMYIKNIADGVQYQFDNFVLAASPGPDCPTSYYTYQQPLANGAPTLSDLFSGQAHFQSLQESQELHFSFNPAEQINWYGSKLPVLYNSQDGKYYGYTRGYGPNQQFNMYLLVSDDAVNFTEVGTIFDSSVTQTPGLENLLDGHISVDYSVCPSLYVMAIEVGGAFYASSTTTPFIGESWSRPIPIVWPAGSNNNRSASTPVFLFDGNQKYAAWTVLDNGAGGGKTQDSGTESTYSKALAIQGYTTFLGNSDIGTITMPAEANTHCTSS